MIRFTLARFARSFLWVPPAMLLVTWTSVVLADGGPPLANLVATAPALAICTAWATIAIGGIDDDAHRDLLAAAVGSHAALHRRRAAAAAVLCTVVVVAVTCLLAAMAIQPGRGAAWTIGAGLVLGGAATATGIAIGTCLHPPVVRNRGITVLVATAAIVAVLAAPPVTRALRAFERGDVAPIGVGFALAASGAIAATSAAAAIARRRA